MSPHIKQLFEHGPAAILLLHLDGRIVEVNPHAERLFRYERSELLDATIDTLVPHVLSSRRPDPVAGFGRAWPSRPDLLGVRNGGGTFEVEVDLVPADVDGAQYLLCSVIDLSARRKGEQWFRTAVEAAPNGMIVVDARGRIVLANARAQEIFGFPREELLGQPIQLLVPDESRAHHAQFVESYSAEPQPRPMGMGRDVWGRHRSGRLIPVEIGLQPISADGESYIISSVVDISVRKHAEAEIQRKTAELEAFAYRTSHDLKSPLKSIAGMAECVLEFLDDGDRAAARDGLARITGLTGNLLTLIDDILALTRIDSADEPVSSFDFGAFAGVCRDKFAAGLAAGQVDLQFDLRHRVPLHVQPTRLTQVLDNLIGNAIKYVDPRKSEHTVRMLTFNTESALFVRVEDNGPGIPAERQGEVFGMFKRFHGASIPGSGLGLYIVRKQVCQLGAEISFESDASGTSFRLAFPLDADPEPLWGYSRS